MDIKIKKNINKRVMYKMVHKIKDLFFEIKDLFINTIEENLNPEDLEMFNELRDRDNIEIFISVLNYSKSSVLFFF